MVPGCSLHPGSSGHTGLASGLTKHPEPLPLLFLLSAKFFPGLQRTFHRSAGWWPETPTWFPVLPPAPLLSAALNLQYLRLSLCMFMSISPTKLYTPRGQGPRLPCHLCPQHPGQGARWGLKESLLNEWSGARGSDSRDSALTSDWSPALLPPSRTNLSGGSSRQRTLPPTPRTRDRPVHGGAPDNPVQRPRGLEAPVLSASGSFIPRRSLDERHG